jgi:hypothetical protein
MLPSERSPATVLLASAVIRVGGEFGDLRFSTLLFIQDIVRRLGRGIARSKGQANGPEPLYDSVLAALAPLTSGPLGLSLDFPGGRSVLANAFLVRFPFQDLCLAIPFVCFDFRTFNRYHPHILGENITIPGGCVPFG